MKKYGIAIALISALLILVAAPSRVFAFRAEVLPPEIGPGEAFLIRVQDTGMTAAAEIALDRESPRFTSCGRGCFETIRAVGLDTPQGNYPIKVKVGKTVMKVHVMVRRAVFPTINLALPEKKVILSPEDLARARKEEELLESIWRKDSPRLWLGKFVLPLQTVISTRFGLKRILNKERVSIHKGIDMRGRAGQEIRASNRGKVVLVKNLFFGGNTVVLDHGMGIYSIYMHLSKFSVQPGVIVSKGQTVGLVGSTGRATGPHLHFSIKVLGISADPVSFTRLPL